MLAKIFSATLQGIEARIIEVEVDISNGLPSFGVVGLADASIRESKERIRASLKNSGFNYPIARISVNLAPADIFKYGTQFDLPMAVGIMSASGQISFEADETMFLGELSMDGQIRPVRGVLAMVIAAKERGIKQVFVPKNNEAEALMVEGVEIVAASNLSELVSFLSGAGKLTEPAASCALRILSNNTDVDFAEVIGQDLAKRAIEIAVAGGHNLLMTGPPGIGKTLLAQAASSIVPEPDKELFFEIIKIQSAAGMIENGIQAVPFRNPHHNISIPALIGGGRMPRPGEVSLAHGGILFLDELPEFSKSALENLREPLENCRITVSRFNGSYSFPADFIFIAAQNPCPCGYYGDEKKNCLCSPSAIASYARKISGPILDRIDLQVRIFREYSQNSPAETSSDILKRVKKARQRQLQRQGKLNKRLNKKEIEKFVEFEKGTLNVFNGARDKLSFSLRTYFKLIKIALTLSDLEGAPAVSAAHASEAMTYRFSD